MDQAGNDNIATPQGRQPYYYQALLKEAVHASGSCWNLTFF